MISNSQNTRIIIPSFFLPLTCTWHNQKIQSSPDLPKIDTDVVTTPTIDKVNPIPDISPPTYSLHRLSIAIPTTVANIPGRSSPLTPTGLPRGPSFQATEDWDQYFVTRTTPTQTSTQWSFAERQGYTAMFAGIDSLTRTEQVVQIGWVGRIYDDDGQVVPYSSIPQDSIQDLQRELWEKRMIPVFLPDKMAFEAYEGYCKSDLYPLLHYILQEIDFDGTAEQFHWESYIQANQAFAEIVKQNIEEVDVIFCQDYHLSLLPSMLRNMQLNVRIGIFVHTPFPSSEIFRACPRRKEILEGLLGADLVGFQTYSYARHFMSCCTRLLGLEVLTQRIDLGDRQVQVSVFPIGIDVQRTIQNQQRPEVLQTMELLRQVYHDKILIVGRERLDQVEGVEHKLNAFSKFLQLYPSWIGKVVLIQVTTPPKRASPKFESKISDMITRLNGKYGSLNWIPVHHFHQHIDQDEWYSLLRLANACLVTSTRDGMNITSHEFVVCQQENKGVLILSEFTGSAGSLNSATLVNPYDYLQVAQALNEALEMSSSERELRHGQLLERVTRQTAQFWAKSCVRELFRIQVFEELGPTPLAKGGEVLKAYLQSKQRLILLDYDGTLTPIRKIPSAALPSARMLQALEMLARDEKNRIFIISGRDQKTLEQWLGHIPELGLVSEHGSFIRYPNEQGWLDLSQGMDMSWKDEVLKIFEYYTERTQGSFIETKRNAITWHYRLADAEFGSYQAKEAQHHLESAITPRMPVSVLVGKKNLEVRPVGINKGVVLTRLWHEVEEKPDFLLVAGDDVTDEDSFKAVLGLEDAHYVLTLAIGDVSKRTKATNRLTSPDSLIQLLELLAKS